MTLQQNKDIILLFNAGYLPPSMQADVFVVGQRTDKRERTLQQALQSHAQILPHLRTQEMKKQLTKKKHRKPSKILQPTKKPQLTAIVQPNHILLWKPINARNMRKNAIK